MSGFVGILNRDGSPIDPILLERMTDALAFRGPEGRSTWCGPAIGLGHAWLRVADRPEPHVQPLTRDSRSWIVADARVDARQELLDALAAAGIELSPMASDVELILAAYEAWGEECAAHLLGDFSFAIWDDSHRRLFCARDQLGVKPLFFAERGAVVTFSNTLECLRLHPAVSGTLNDDAIADFLLFGENRDAETTTFSDIQTLPPAHSASWTSHGARRRRYWVLPSDPPLESAPAGEYAERFHALLRDSVRDRLQTRRAGVFMSGGLDSPTLAAAAVGLLREDASEFFLEAMTSVYDRLVPDAERGYAQQVADFLDIPVHFDVRDDEISIARWSEVSARTPEPVDNPAAFAAAIAFLKPRVARARVFLYGEGPDNALQYEWRPYLSFLLRGRRLRPLLRAFAADARHHPRVPLWSSVREVAGQRRTRKMWRPAFPRWLNDDFARRCRCRERWEDGLRASSSDHPTRPRGHASFAPVRWRRLFEQCDLQGALTQSEIRHPFLDLRLLRFMLELPAMPWCRNKLIIRRAMRGRLPRVVLDRKKSPVQGSADWQRVLATGLPRPPRSRLLSQYVNVDHVPIVPATALELRSALRPLGLGYWLQQEAAGRGGTA